MWFGRWGSIGPRYGRVGEHFVVVQYCNVNLHLHDEYIQKVYSTSVAFVTEAVPRGTKTIEPWEFALVGHFRQQYLDNDPELRGARLSLMTVN